jgi:hypothetical protein
VTAVDVVWTSVQPGRDGATWIVSRERQKRELFAIVLAILLYSHMSFNTRYLSILCSWRVTLPAAQNATSPQQAFQWGFKASDCNWGDLTSLSSLRISAFYLVPTALALRPRCFPDPEDAAP